MDKEVVAIITTSLTFITLVGKPYIDAIYREYPPAIKRHISFIKKSLLFILLYILPILGMALLLMDQGNITKMFVFVLVMNACVLTANIILSLYFSGLDDHNAFRRSSMKHSNSFIDLLEKNTNLIAGHTALIQGLSKNQEEILKTLNEIKEKTNNDKT